jgi:hypothetical protein
METDAVFPPPYDADRSHIVTRVDRTRASTRAKLANSKEVATFLKAGSDLIERELGFHELTRSRSHPQAGTYWSGLRFLTQKAVMEQVKRLAEPFDCGLSEGTFRTTWKSHDDYIDDLLTFFFHPINYEHQYGVSEMTRKGWFAHESLVDAVYETAQNEVAALCEMPLFRLQIMMSALAGRDDGIRKTIADNYRCALDPWVQIYEETFAARGLRLRDDLSVRDLADILAAVVEGSALRSLGDSSESPERNRAGKAILLILNSCLVPSDGAPPEPLADEFDRWTRPIQPEG